jgi:hypothetical protein
VVVQFLEIHNQDINDLLSGPVEVVKKGKKNGMACTHASAFAWRRLHTS